MKKSGEGLLIAFDGIDSSGKATHTQELVRRLRYNGHTVHFFQSPDYITKTGKRIKELLQHPEEWQKISWLDRMKLFADNRAEHRAEVVKALSRGEHVVYDRYVSSSITFFTVEALVANKRSSRKKVQQQVAEYEYGQNNMPKENVSIFLDVPVEVSRALLEKRKQKRGDAAEYTDQLLVQQKLYNEYDLLCSTYPEQFLRTHCVSGSELLAIPDVAELVWQGLLNRFPQLRLKA